MTSRAQHWESIYSAKGGDEVSWFEANPEVSTRLVLRAGVPGSVVDVGAGASALADALLAAGVAHVTLLDLSVRALAATSSRLAEQGLQVTTVAADVLTYAFDETFDVWHDRAVFHFLTDDADRASYVAQVRRALLPGGLLVVGTFAEDGPETCSGLPVRRYGTEALVEAFGSGFSPEHDKRVEHRTPWGAVQPFTWVVLRRAEPA